MTGKNRLSASVDAALLEAAESAVARGSAPTLSAWVNDALRLKLAHDARMVALADFVAAYEHEHGEITQAEIDAATRRARARAVTVSSKPSSKQTRSSRRGGGSR